MPTSVLPSDLRSLLPQVLRLVREAGAEILAVYSRDFEVQHKKDHSPLTVADMASNRFLTHGLGQLTPRLPILSEESATVPFSERSGWECYWLIDPLDGTREFVNRNGEFTVNVALICNSYPVLGVVYAPVGSICYYALEDGGAYRQTNEGPAEQIRVGSVADGPVRVVGSRSHRGASLDAFLRHIGDHELVPMGSSLKFCVVAEGGADVYPRLGPTCEWDTAAAQAVVEAAGGQVIDLDGARLVYNRKDDLRNPFFLVFGDPSIDWRRFL